MPTYYSVKKEERIVRAILVIKNSNDYYTFEGVAKCNPTDQWDEITGKRLARARALLKFKKAEKEHTIQRMRKFQRPYNEYVQLREKGQHISRIIQSLKDEIDSFKG